MDLEKLGHLMDEAKGGDVAFYLLVAFSAICPGFMVIFTFKPELIISYDTIKLLILCISIGGTSLLLFIVVMWVSAFEVGANLTLRLTITMSAIASILAVTLAIVGRNSMGAQSWWLLWLSINAAIMSVVCGSDLPWYRRCFLNSGVLLLIVIGLIIARKHNVWEALVAVPTL